MLAPESVARVSVLAAPIPLGHGSACDSVVRRAYDQMEVVRLTAMGSGLAVPSKADIARLPFVALYAMSSVELDIAGGQSVVLRDGDCYLARNRPNLRMEMVGPGKLLVIFLPTDAVALHRRALEEADGSRCATRQGTASLVGQLLHGLALQLEIYQPASPARLSQHVAGLLTLMWSDALATEVGWSRSKLLERSKEFIELHLSEIDLTPERVAKAQHMSARNLYRLFESEGLTIGGWIRHRRLEHCRIDLVDGALKSLPVSHIASQWGFWEAAHFSRLFKTTYGLSPRAYRATYQTEHGSAVLPRRLSLAAGI